ncbi:Protein MgtC [Acetobacteraceae bacterium EV16G]|uniref:Protein MgtC n=2 Tax=Sorlinia euscelidii TaxID=3081148 RepID=A0ABU7TZ19_9PROT
MRFIETFDPTSFGDTTVSFLSAFLFGTLIGAERQYRQRSAGVRTNALVALGGAAFVDLAQRIGGEVESLRVIAYVVSGIGFLGAGSIIKEGANVRGLNTAATLWCSAAVGACVGSDMLAEGFLLTFFVIAGNTILRSVVRFVDRLPIRSRTIEAVYGITARTLDEQVSSVVQKLQTRLEADDYVVGKLTVREDGADHSEIDFNLLTSSNDIDVLKKIVSEMADDPEISEISWTVNAE